eukprot:6183956-Pleurochrysis_carterae.AAC.1
MKSAVTFERRFAVTYRARGVQRRCIALTTWRRSNDHQRARGGGAPELHAGASDLSALARCLLFFRIF